MSGRPGAAPAGFEALFRSVRAAASANTWSRGVELARGDAASLDPGSDPEAAELEFSVRVPGRPVAQSVTLYVEDEEWDCNCDNQAPACEHVAAAAIALRTARKEGRSTPRADEATGRVRYDLERRDNGLAFARSVVVGDRAIPLETTLEAISRGRVEGPRAAASGDDMAVEVALGARLHGVFESGTWKRLLPLLARCTDVRLDGQPVRFDTTPLRPRVVLEDVERGFRLRLRRPEGVTHRLTSGADGLALCEDGRVRAFGPSGLNGRELDELPRGRTLPFERAAELVTEILPDLEARIDVERLSKRLPRTTRRERPRLRIETERRGDALSVLPLLVYGDPPIARVDGDDLVALDPDGRQPIPIRDRPAENEARSRLVAELGVAPGRRLELRGAEALGLAERLRRFAGADVAGAGHLAFEQRGSLTPHVAPSADHFEVWFDVEDEAAAKRDGATAQPSAGARVSGEAVLDAWKRGDGWVALDGGGFAPLPSDWLRRFGPAIADLLAARRDDGALTPAALPDLARVCEELGEAAPPELDGLRALLDASDGSALPAASLPDDLDAELRDYQREGVDWLAFLGQAGLGALLADDMGLGKTLQTLCAVGGRTLVVAPTSVLHTWRHECERFRPQLRVGVFHGARRELEEGADLTLTSYALLRQDADLLCNIDWDTVVLDEAQAIKNADSQVARAAHRLRGRARIALTGTPVENRLEELWSILHFLNPGWLGRRRDFRDRYATPIAQGDESVAAHLRERIRPFVLRRVKEDVASELPERSDVVISCELSKAERRVYDAVQAATRKEVVEKLASGGSVFGALEALLRLRQAACHTGLVPGQTADASTKVDELVARLEEVTSENHAALVFSQWTGLLDRIEPALEASSIPFTRLDGSTRNRDEPIERFQRGEVPVMLVSLRAGGSGLTLTAADHVFLMDPWWNPAVEEQAAARAHRIGQTRPVFVHRLVALGTVEERILALHERKRALFDQALAGSGDGITREDLVALLD